MAIVYTSSLGWTAGQDITSAFITQIASMGAGTVGNNNVLVFDHAYVIDTNSTISMPNYFTLAGGVQGAGFDRPNTDTSNNALIDLGLGNVVTDLTVTHSDAPQTGYVGGSAQAGVDYHQSRTFNSTADDVTIKNSSFHGNVSVLIDLSATSNTTIQDCKFDYGLAQVRWLGGVKNITINDTLFDRAMGDGIKSVIDDTSDDGFADGINMDGCVFLKANRDGIDTTGGFKNSIVDNSYFVDPIVSGLDIKTGIDSADNFRFGTPINEDILIRNSEFIDCGNAIVLTTLDPAGLLNEGNIRNWAVQNVNVENSTFENIEDIGQNRIYLVKDSYNAHWNNVLFLGNVITDVQQAFLGTTIPEDINGTNVTTGSVRPQQPDSYYRGLAGPDWANIQYPSEVTYVNVPVTVNFTFDG